MATTARRGIPAVALVKANELIYIGAHKIIKASSRLADGRGFIIARRYRISILLRSAGLTADRDLSGLEMSSRGSVNTHTRGRDCGRARLKFDVSSSREEGARNLFFGSRKKETVDARGDGGGEGHGKRRNVRNLVK